MMPIKCVLLERIIKQLSVEKSIKISWFHLIIRGTMAEKQVW